MTNRHSLAVGEYCPPTDPWLDIISEDDHILVLNKPSGLLTVPGRGIHLQDCLAARAQDHAPAARTVHRLDMETSGLVVMAKTPEAQAHLGKQFERRKTEKRYVARVAGHIAGDSGVVKAPLICDWPNRPRQMVDPATGKPAETRWTVLERVTDPVTGLNSSLVALIPITGRSHQLRVHMLHIGHPIQGDRLYGNDDSQTAAPRLLLHAERLAFHHPDGGAFTAFNAPIVF